MNTKVMFRVKGAFQKVNLFNYELIKIVDLSRFLKTKRGRPKVEKMTYWTAPLNRDDLGKRKFT